MGHQVSRTPLITFRQLARSRGVCPPAGLLRVIGCEASAASPSASSSSEEELKRRGSSFSRFLSAPEGGRCRLEREGVVYPSDKRRRGSSLTCSDEH